MKRVITILLIGIMMLIMSACGVKTASIDTETESKSIEATNEQDSSISESKTESEKDEESHYADILPVTNDYFKNGEVSIIDQDGGTSYSFRIINYQDGEYEKYIEACKSNGFDDVTYEGENDGGKMFYAYSSDGKYYLQVMLGYQIEAIDITCKESTKDRTDSNITSKENESSIETSDDGEINPEFKETMDSYEEFFDKYCEFMKKYSNSDDVTSMLTDYTDYMTRYTETMKKMEAINQNDLSTAEVAYYTEVSARISQKLLEIAQ